MNEGRSYTASIEYLVRVQAEIKQCRRLAAEIFDRETAAKLLKMADELEQRAREQDRK